MRTRAALVAATMDLARAATAATATAGDPRHAAADLPKRAALPLPDSEAAWRQIIAIASAHLILPALHQAIIAGADDSTISRPQNRDALDFLSEIHAANGARNGRLRASLIATAAALNKAGIIPLVLKGGAFLLDPVATRTGGAPQNPASMRPAPWRFMSDLDLLLPEHRLAEAVRVVNEAGFTAPGDSYDPQGDAHYPPLVSPCGEIVIELHSRIFTDKSAKPCPDTLIGNAKLISLAGAKLHQPSPIERIAHLIGHAQLHNGFYRKKRILLRDLVDLSMLLRNHQQAISWPDILQNFTTTAEREAACAFIAAWQLWQQQGASHHDRQPYDRDAAKISRESSQWAVQALARLSWPQWRRGAAAMANRLAWDLKSLGSQPEHRRRALATLRNPAKLRLNLARRYAKLRQMLWA